ncbi:MAG: hypothetical protein NUV96_01985 [Candidatus Colwellbacteria bacterium]|nr:hypothetical protein [Candidatus Colwellbacteria bacterium]
MIRKEKEKGQLMLLSVLLITSAVLAATTVASLLILFQLRQAADAKSSAQAVFAADAGVERALYERYRENSCGGADFTILSREDAEELDDEFFISNQPQYGSPDVGYVVAFSGVCDDPALLVQSAGISDRSSRAFRIYIQGIANFGGQFVE